MELTQSVRAEREVTSEIQRHAAANFVGAGLSLDKKLNEWVAFHTDVRASLTLDSVSAWGLPLSRTGAGFSIGPELRVAENTSLNLQYDGSSSPYQPTGSVALDPNAVKHFAHSAT